MIYEWFAETAFTALAYVVSADLMQLSSMAGWRYNGAINSRTAALKRCGFRKEKPYINGKRCPVWFRGPADMPPARIVHDAVRYLIKATPDGRPDITIRRSS